MSLPRFLILAAAALAVAGCSRVDSTEFEKVKADTDEAHRAIVFAKSEAEDAHRAAEAAKKDADMARDEAVQARRDAALVRMEFDKLKADQAKLPDWVRYEGGVLTQTGTFDTALGSATSDSRVNFPIPFANVPEVTLDGIGPDSGQYKHIDLIRSTAVAKVEPTGFVWRQQNNPTGGNTVMGRLKWTARGLAAKG